MPSYVIRLLLLSSASYFLVQMLASVFVAWIAPAAIRRAPAMEPRRAAHFLFALRILPATLSAIVVAVLCVPSYLRFEPRAAEEEIGVACLAAAILGFAAFAFAIYRALSALIRSALYVRKWSTGTARFENETLWVVNSGSALALAGILRPRLLISERAMRDLSKDQLAAALRHEHAHRMAFDNLKRLMIQLAPPFLPRMRSLERAWTKAAEWAADDRAAQGEDDRSQLASALVRVARLQSGMPVPALVTLLVDAEEDLSLRVDRLLIAAPQPERAFYSASIALAAGSLIAAVALSPSALRFVHQLLEHLLD